MPYTFSAASLLKLGTCDERLQQVANRALAKQLIDFGINHGWRDEKTQNALADATPPLSKKRWPDSKHNAMDVLGKPCSLAFDAYPYIRADGKGFIPWSEPRYWHYLAGIIISSAVEVGVTLRWGGDWDGDNFYGDQTFNDLGHFELKDA